MIDTRFNLSLVCLRESEYNNKWNVLLGAMFFEELAGIFVQLIIPRHLCLILFDDIYPKKDLEVC